MQKKTLKKPHQLGGLCFIVKKWKRRQRREVLRMQIPNTIFISFLWLFRLKDVVAPEQRAVRQSAK